MNNLFQEKKALFLLLIGLFFLLLITLYFAFLLPQTRELKAAENATTALETDIAVLKAKIKNDSEQPAPDIKKLERKMPQNPELENFLRSLQELEHVTNSRIEEIEFTYEGQFPEDAAGVEEDVEEDVESEESNESTEEEETSAKDNDEESIPEEPATSIPERMHLITAQLTVFSPDYKHFLQFINEVEKQERITLVDQLEMIKPAEQELLFQQKPYQTIEFTITVTTFYYE